MKLGLCALGAALVMLSSGELFASEPEELPADRDSAEQREQQENRRRGTHFIGELRLGSTVDGVGSFAYGGALGVGGRWYGLPPMYLFGAIDHTSVDRSAPELGPAGSEHLALTGLALGFRVYVPIVEPLRLMADISVGSLSLTSEGRDELGEWSEQMSVPYTELGIGPQFRILHHLSLGARAAIAFVDTSGIERGSAFSAWDSRLTRRTSVLGTATLHF